MSMKVTQKQRPALLCNPSEAVCLEKRRETSLEDERLSLLEWHQTAACKGVVVDTAVCLLGGLNLC